MYTSKFPPKCIITQKYMVYSLHNEKQSIMSIVKQRPHKEIIFYRWETTDSESGFSTRDSHVVRVHRKDRDSSAICRGWYQNQLVPGATILNGEKMLHCAVSFSGQLHLLESFQVMIDRSGTSRLEWQHWDFTTQLPVGLVAFTGETSYVARKGSKYQLGDINPMSGLSGEMKSFDLKSMTANLEKKGQMLVEVEPVSYKLESIRFVDWRAKVDKKEVKLGHRVLANPQPILDPYGPWTEVSTMVTYNASYKFYWGQMEGLIKALPSSGETYSKKQRIDFRWGLPHGYQRHRIMKISAKLQPGTSTNVSVWAYKTRTELPYTAKLVSVFADGKPKMRRIDGFYVETLLTDIEVKHGAPYFTNNGTNAPTTTTTTTTTTSTTTTTTTSSTMSTTTTRRPKRTTTELPTTPNPLRKFYPEDDDDMEDSLEEQMRFDENNIMMSDQGTNKRSSPYNQKLASSSTKTTTASVWMLLALWMVIKWKESNIWV